MHVPNQTIDLNDMAVSLFAFQPARTMRPKVGMMLFGHMRVNSEDHSYA